MDKRGGTGLLTLLLTAALALSGCGVPSDGPAEEIDVEQNDGTGAGANSGEVLSPHTDAELSLDNYLSVAAGNPSTRGERLNQFYENPPSEPLDPAQIVNVVDVHDMHPLRTSDQEEARFRVSGEIVGLYDQWGQLSPPEGKRDFSYDMKLARSQPDGKWRLVDPPSKILLRAGTFNAEYQVAPLYFQRRDSTSLVPDVRYIYADATRDRKRVDLVTWLLDGPSEWLASAVTTAFPSATKLNQPPFLDKNNLIVDLGSDAVTGDENRMAAQLAWTLWGVGNEYVLDLRLNGQPVLQNAFSAFRDLNPTAAYSSDSAPQVHYLTKGRVDDSADALYSDVKNAKYVATSIQKDHVVSVGDDGKVTVHVKTMKKAEEVVTSSKVKGMPGGAVGRPTWIGEETLLVPVGGELLAVNVGEDGVWRVQEGSLASGVGRVSAALDGGRLAMTVGGRAYVVPVLPQGDGTVALGDRRVVDRGNDEVIDVGWSEEHRLVLLGAAPERFLVRATIDNVDIFKYEDEGPSFPPDSLAVSCDSPADIRAVSTEVVVTVGGMLYQTESQGLRPMDVDGAEVFGSAPFYA
ncbi:LpqB family beta-propeller domain-containing protein [Phytomonospora sp. NPDC050363]|uniref:LpqB family beta-propeller domain-containing protein n=1 Tax=Phytomonospora sp. NPDC050363 TaxID=3155642 RepID=UPI0033C5B153